MRLWIEIKEFDRNDSPPQEFIERRSFNGKETKQVRQWSYIPKSSIENVTKKRVKIGENVLEICKIGKWFSRINNGKESRLCNFPSELWIRT